MLHAVCVIGDVQIHVVDQAGDPVHVLGADAHQVHVVAHGAVDGPGIDVDKAQRFGQAAGHGGLPRAGGAVDGNGTVLHGKISFPSFLAAPRPAAWAVAQAICRLKPPV